MFFSFLSIIEISKNFYWQAILLSGLGNWKKDKIVRGAIRNSIKKVKYYVLDKCISNVLPELAGTPSLRFQGHRFELSMS